ncbi:MAG TPA: hypothetical protein VFB54_01975 [Burkholderiales bacterium]|nr:hypothetical protein [Burkholderiales bacterium]
MSRLPGRLDWKSAAWAALVVVLLSIVALALQREMRSAAPVASAVPMTERGVQHAPLSAADEAYAAALWAIHAQVKQDAVRMTFAGLSYQMKDIKASDLRARTEPLTASFRQAQQRVHALHPPPELQSAQDRYLNALQRYEEASKLMAKFSSDANNAHLLKAQELSQLASEDLLRVGDVLWPGEHKPN